MLEVPRSARLAAWGTAVLTGAAGLDEAIAAVEGDDDPHRVVGAGDASAGEAGTGLTAFTDLTGLTALHRVQAGEGAGLVDLVALLARADVTRLLLVLPVPGDVLGLPGPAGFNAVALEAQECVLAEVSPTLGLGVVPSVEFFGSAWEQGENVTWTVHPTAARRVTDTGSLGEADRALKEALLQATEALRTLDVARWREDAAGRITAIRDGVLAPASLPPSAPPRVVSVLSSAARVRSIVELATQDDGAATTSWEADRRREALRGLDAVARRGIVAAVNAVGPLP